MRILAVVLVTFALSGCYVAVNGHRSTHGDTTAGATTTTTTTTATRGHASIGPARVSASFGRSTPAGSPGGHIGFSRAASAVLVVGLVIAEVANYFSNLSKGGEALAAGPGRSIADTCSCYGYRPESPLTSAPAAE